MFLEDLESRRLCSVTASLDTGGTLTVTGGEGFAVELSSDNRFMLVQEYAGLATWYVTRFTFNAASVRDITIYGSEGPDTISVSDRIALPTGIYGQGGNDYIVGGGGMDAITGGNGEDWIQGRGGNDFLYGSAGNDTLNGGAGQDYMNGSTGNDTATYFERTEDLILRPNGRWESGTRSGWLSSENDLINHDIETVTGGSGNDQLFANTVRPGELRGGAGNDTLYGSYLNDRLYGEQGDDVIHGGLGNDHMVGGFGSDLFYARDGGADVILAGNEDYSGSGTDYDLAQVDAGLDWSMGIHAFLP
jgi:Ca2+-binding RTX toxin-like protein